MKVRTKKPAPSASERYMQLRLARDTDAGAALIAKIEKISAANGLSLNDVANMAVAAGLQMVERKLSELRPSEPETQAA